MIWRSVVFSIAGLSVGFILGSYYHCGFGKGDLLFSRKRYNKNADIPGVIPKVIFDENGEPLIAREEVHHASPIPRSIAIILLILAALSVAYNAVQQAERNNDNARHNQEQARALQANAQLLTQLQHQQNIIDANEKRLEDLVLEISLAKTPGQVTTAIQKFLKSSAQAKQQEQQYQTNSPQSKQNNPGSQGSQGSQSSPAPSPSYSHTAYSTSPSPSKQPSQSNQPTQSNQPSPKPSSTHSYLVCVPVTNVCLPPGTKPARNLTLESGIAPGIPDSTWWYLPEGAIILTAGALYLIDYRHRRIPLYLRGRHPSRASKDPLQ